MRRVLNSGGQQRVAHLRELASDAEKLQQLAKTTEARGQNILANSALVGIAFLAAAAAAAANSHASCTFVVPFLPPSGWYCVSL